MVTAAPRVTGPLAAWPLLERRSRHRTPTGRTRQAPRGSLPTGVSPLISPLLPLFARTGDGAAGSSGRVRAPVPGSPRQLLLPASLPAPGPPPFPGPPLAHRPCRGVRALPPCQTPAAAPAARNGAGRRGGGARGPAQPGSGARNYAAAAAGERGCGSPRLRRGARRGRWSQPGIFLPLLSLAGPRKATEVQHAGSLGTASVVTRQLWLRFRVVGISGLGGFICGFLLLLLFPPLRTTPANTHRQLATTTRKSVKGERTGERDALWVGRDGFLCRGRVPCTADPNATAHPPPPLCCRLCQLLQPSGHHCPCPERIYKSLAVLQHQARW